PKYVIKETKRVKTSANSADEASKTWMQSPPMTAQTISHVQSFQLFTDSHHQGWVSDPSAGSWSWFEIGLCRLDESSGQITPKTMSDGSPAFWESHRHPVEESEDAFEIEEDLSDEDLDQDIHEEDEEDEIQEEIQFDTQSLTLSDDDNVSATFFTDLNEGGIDGQGDDDDNEDMDEGFSDQDIPNENLMGVGEVGLDDEDLEVDFGGYKLHNGSQFGPEHPIWDHVEEGDVLVVQLKAQFGGWANYAHRFTNGMLKVIKTIVTEFQPGGAPDIRKYSHVSAVILKRATIMAPRRGRVASPEADGEDDTVPTQQTVDGAEEYEEDDGGDQQVEEVDGDDEDAPSRKRTRVSDEGAAVDVEPKNEPVPEIAPRVTLPRDPSDG
ncbi:hypothetical protein FRC07_014685, partial [Ceratobasidium sp. 392]